MRCAFGTTARSFAARLDVPGRDAPPSRGRRRFTKAEMDSWLRDRGVTLIGADLDESPMAYRRLPEVLARATTKLKEAARNRLFKPIELVDYWQICRWPSKPVK
jgi:hypothetical protein